jgi:predicted nucleic acid-binding protein
MSSQYLEINNNSLVCDSSSLISLAQSCFLDVIPFLNQRMYGSFIYPKMVRVESIERPISAKNHALRALRLREYEESNIIKFLDLDVDKDTKEIMSMANHIFETKNKAIRIVDEGEAAQIALAIRLNIKNLVIDERTTRTLLEAPFKLKEHLERESRKPVNINQKLFNSFLDKVGKFNIIRSSELIILAYEYGYFDKYGNEKEIALESSLFTLKFSGCSLSYEEINDFMREINAKQK